MDEGRPLDQWVVTWGRILDGPPPPIVGIAGGVAAGKSTAAATLELHAPGSVSVLAMDDFLMSNAELEARDLSAEKGFPHTYRVDEALGALDDLRSGRETDVPVYSHDRYDVIAEQRRVVLPADTIVVEGLHVLGEADLRAALDLAIYLRTDLDLARQRYLARFAELRRRAVDDPDSFYRWALEMDESLSDQLVDSLWDSINLPNHRRFIEPTERHADYVVIHRPGESPTVIDRGHER